MRLHAIGAAALATMPLLGCASISTIDFPLPVHSQSHLERGDDRQLLMYTVGSGPEQREWADVVRAIGGVYGNDADKARTAVDFVRAACVEPPPPEATTRTRPQSRFGGGLAAPIVGAAIDFAASALRREINRWASTYEASWSARRVTEFYAGRPGGDGEARLAHACFALIRTVAEAAGRRTVFLHIGKFVTSTDGVAVRLEPLLHAHLGTKARVGSGGSFNAAMVLTIQGVWIDERRGVVATRDAVFSATLDFGTSNLNEARVTLYNEASGAAASSTWFPNVPLSRRDGMRFGTGPVNVTATVAETAGARDLAAAAAGVADGFVEQIAERVREEVAAMQ